MGCRPRLCADVSWCAGDQVFFVCGGWLGSSSSCVKQGASLPASCRLATALEPAELPATTVDPRKALKDYTVCLSKYALTA